MIIKIGRKTSVSSQSLVFSNLPNNDKDHEVIVEKSSESTNV